MARVLLIVGARRTGKTSLAREAVAMWRARGLRVTGVLQEAKQEGGDRVAYEAVRLAQPSDRVVVARKGAPAANETPICSFSFDDEAFSRVGTWLAADGDASDVIVIDEVSKAESRGRGHAAAIERALARDVWVVLCVRADELVHVMERFGIEEVAASIETTDRGSLAAFTDAVRGA